MPSSPTALLTLAEQSGFKKTGRYDGRCFSFGSYRGRNSSVTGYRFWESQLAAVLDATDTIATSANL